MCLCSPFFRQPVQKTVYLSGRPVILSCGFHHSLPCTIHQIVKPHQFGCRQYDKFFSISLRALGNGVEKSYVFYGISKKIKAHSISGSGGKQVNQPSTDTEFPSPLNQGDMFIPGVYKPFKQFIPVGLLAFHYQFSIIYKVLWRDDRLQQGFNVRNAHDRHVRLLQGIKGFNPAAYDLRRGGHRQEGQGVMSREMYNTVRHEKTEVNRCFFRLLCIRNYPQHGLRCCRCKACSKPLRC